MSTYKLRNVIFLYSAAVDALPKQRDECGINDFIAKPVNPDFLYQTLLKSLAREKQQPRLQATPVAANCSNRPHDIGKLTGGIGSTRGS